MSDKDDEITISLDEVFDDPPTDPLWPVVPKKVNKEKAPDPSSACPRCGSYSCIVLYNSVECFNPKCANYKPID